MIEEQVKVVPKTIQDRISELLDSVQSSAADAGNFLAGELPLVAQEIVKWKMIAPVVWIIALVTFSILGCVVCRLSAKSVGRRDSNGKLYAFDEEYAQSDSYRGFIIMSYVIPGSLHIFVFYNLYNLLYVYMCPRLVILDYLKGFI